MKSVQISFDEPTHKYTDDEGNVYTSTTQLIGHITPTYDSEFWCMYRALDQMKYKLRPEPASRLIYVNGKWYNLPELYAGLFRTIKSPKQIIGEWKAVTQRSLDRGNATHNYLEDCINSFYGETTINSSNSEFKLHNVSKGYRIKIVDIKQLEDSPLKKTYALIYNTLVKLVKKGYTIYAEKRIYSYEHKVSGTIDVLAVKGDDFYIIDWKTNKDPLKFESGYYKKKWNIGRTEKVKTDEWIKTDDRYKRPLHNLTNCKGNTYALQLSIYAYICELWGLKCKGLILFHIRRTDTGDYPPNPYTLRYLKHEVSLLMDWKLQKERNKQYYKQ